LKKNAPLIVLPEREQLAVPGESTKYQSFTKTAPLNVMFMVDPEAEPVPSVLSWTLDREAVTESCT